MSIDKPLHPTRDTTEFAKKVESTGPPNSTIPHDFLTQCAVILKDSGADTKSQEKALSKIAELIIPPIVTPVFSTPTPSSPVNTNQKINPVNRPSEVPSINK